MNKQALIPSVIIVTMVMIMFAAVAVSNEWRYEYNEEPSSPIDFKDGENPDSINYWIFEEYGPILMVLGLLMFGAVLGGVYIAKEDDDDDTN